MGLKKVLFVATVVKMHINAFHIPFLKLFKSWGWETHVCARNDFDTAQECVIPYCDQYYNLQFMRSPYKLGNIKIYRELKRIIDANNYDIIHCNTPVGGILTRLASCKARKKGTKVIYTAHGFHFYKGAPLINWLLYYPVEKICSYFTDVLITINKEDYELAKRKMHAKHVAYIPGVGVDTGRFAEIMVDRASKRKELGVPENAIMLLSVGELNKNKNHEVIIKAMAKLDNPDIHYCIAGEGDLYDYLLRLSDSLGIGNKVHLLGYREDIGELCKTADIFCFPSLREGLSVSLIEAMAAGLPCILSKIRGNTDLIAEGEGGLFCRPDDYDGFAEAIKKLACDAELRRKMGQYNLEAAEKYDLDNIINDMALIYKGDT